MRQYRPGDTITIDVTLKDQSEIQVLVMAFQLKGQQARINLESNRSVPAGTITLTYDVTENTAPGFYELVAFYAVDSRNNRSDFPRTTEWDFEVVNNPVDTEGPELVGVNVK